MGKGRFTVYSVILYSTPATKNSVRVLYPVEEGLGSAIRRPPNLTSLEQFMGTRRGWAGRRCKSEKHTREGHDATFAAPILESNRTDMCVRLCSCGV
jgi:hypothetical protein